jgi:CheY-like chemotaxis protein
MILLDWHMPSMDGGEMMRIVRANSNWRTIPVVLITGDAAAKNRTLEVQAAGYLKKPIDAFDLLTMVDHVLRHPS